MSFMQAWLHRTLVRIVISLQARRTLNNRSIPGRGKRLSDASRQALGHNQSRLEWVPAALSAGV